MERFRTFGMEIEVFSFRGKWNFGLLQIKKLTTSIFRPTDRRFEARRAPDLPLDVGHTELLSYKSAPDWSVSVRESDLRPRGGGQYYCCPTQFDCLVALDWAFGL